MKIIKSTMLHLSMFLPKIILIILNTISDLLIVLKNTLKFGIDNFYTQFKHGQTATKTDTNS